MTDLHGWITQRVDKTERHARGGQVVVLNEQGRYPLPEFAVDRDALLRRCEADRRILARHTLDLDNWYEPACKGCRTYGDQDMAYTDNLNECPELLDLGYAHGLTDAILASLDQPEKPPRPEPKPLGGTLPPGVGATADVPPALRGPNWKGRR